MATLALLALCASAASAQKAERRRSWIEKPATPDGIGVFTQPLGSLVMAAGAIAYIPLGLNLPITDRTEVVVEVTGMTGDVYGCESQTRGGWAAAGVAWFVAPRKWLSRGPFLQPKLIVRYFDTSGAREVEPRRKHAGCAASDAANIDSADYELHAGLDAGYSMRAGVFELAFVVGASAGLCHSCFGDRVFFWGQSDFASVVYDPPPPRTNRLSLGLNLNLLRLGARF
jgi:hypothetical protein